MRTALGKYKGKAIRVTATVAGFGMRPKDNRTAPTLLLRSICDKEFNELSHHCWMCYEPFANISPRVGDIVEFVATVKSYKKNRQQLDETCYRPGKTDFRLANPRSIRKL